MIKLCKIRKNNMVLNVDIENDMNMILQVNIDAMDHFH